MKETKESPKTTKKSTQKEKKDKIGIGDIIFRAIIIISIFLICILFCIFYIRNISREIANDTQIAEQEYYR